MAVAPAVAQRLWAFVSFAALGLHVAASLGHPTARAALVAGAVAGLLHLAVWRTDAQTPGPRQVLAGALVAWGLLVVLPPVLSDDIWRYVLDGQTACRGVSPFAYPPASPKVADWLAALPHPVNHPHLPTIYPPVAQAAFAVVACVGGGVTALKALFAVAWWSAAYAFAHLTVAPVAETPEQRQSRIGRGFLAGISHPLPLFAIAGDGHVDALGLLLLALAVAGLVRQRASWAIVGAAGATAVKLFPLLLLLGGAAGQGVRRVAWAVGAALLVVGMWFPLAPSLKLAPGSTATFATTWSHQPALPALIVPTVRWGLAAAQVPTSVAVDAPDWLPAPARAFAFPERPTAYGLQTTRWLDHGQWAALIARLLAGLVVGGVLWWTRTAPTRQAVVAVTTALLLCLPVVHPWYVLWAWLPLVSTTGADGVSRTTKQYVSAWGALALLGWWGAASVADGGPWVDHAVTAGLWHALPAIVVALLALRRRVASTRAK